MHKSTDYELLLEIQLGSHADFAELVERHHQRFYRLAFRYLNQKELAEDIVQEAFIQLWENPQSYRPDKSQFTTWFYRIIINKCLDYQKRKKLISLKVESDVIDESNIKQEQSLIEIEQNNWLEEAMNQLPDSQKTALNLCFYDELSNKQAATIMGVSLKALQSLIMRAKTKLKKQYQIDMESNHETRK